MSSTNRYLAAERHVSDYYVTPIPAIVEFLRAFDPPVPKLILDPCAGGDAKHAMSYPNAIKNHIGWNDSTIRTVDTREDSHADVKADFLTWTPDHTYDMAITNPPFNLALDVIKKCLTIVRPGGHVIMLLRLNFFGSQERSDWFKKNMPSFCYVHSKRLKFTGTSNTDSIEYMHAVWVVGEHPEFTRLKIL